MEWLLRRDRVEGAHASVPSPTSVRRPENTADAPEVYHQFRTNSSTPTSLPSLTCRDRGRSGPVWTGFVGASQPLRL